MNITVANAERPTKIMKDSQLISLKWGWRHKMAKIKRMRKIPKSRMCWTIVVLDENGQIIQACEIRQEPDENCDTFNEIVKQEVDSLKAKYPKHRIVRRQVANIGEFKMRHPEVFLPIS